MKLDNFVKSNKKNSSKYLENKDDNIHKSEALKWYDKRTLVKCQTESEKY